MINSVVLIGRLTKDVELKYIPGSEMAVATFTLAIDRPVGQGKEKQTDFPRITVFGKQAENCEKFISKGKMVGITGRLQTGSYKDKDGKTVYTTDVIADRVEFLSPKDEDIKPSKPPKPVEQISGFQMLEDDDPDLSLPF
jgi:single-strand DNA-binding protein